MKDKRSTSTDRNFSSDGFIARLRARDSDAISVLVRTYTEQIYRASLGLGFESTQAQELTQSVWVTFFDVVANFKGASHVRTFLFGILYNKASEVRRDHSRFDLSDPVEEVLEQRFNERGHWIKPPIDPEAFLNSAETASIIEKCLDALPLTQRLAFTLKEIEEEDTPDICKIMDVTVTNLGVLLYRARNRLRECVEGKTKVGD